MAYTDTDELFSLLPAFEAQKVDYLAAMLVSQADADGIIDSALDSRYVVPFGNYSKVSDPPNECPRIVTTIASMLARSIFLSGEYMSNVANSQPRVSMVLWDRAWMLLNKIIAGEMQVNGPGATALASTNLGIWFRKRDYISPLKDFDLESPLYPRLHDRMRIAGRMNQLRMVGDNGEVTYYVGMACNG